MCVWRPYLIAAFPFPPFYSVTSPYTLFKRFYVVFVTLKLLVLSYCDISGVLPGGGDDYPPGERPCLPSQSRATAAAWLFCQPQTFSSNCSFPISLPSNFPFESCSSWCFSISQLLMIFFPFRFHSSDLRMFCWCSYCRHL